jgi:flagellar FliL protein
MADEKAQEKVKKKSHLKLFIIIGVAVAVAVGASVGIMMFMNGNKAEAHKVEKPDAEAAVVQAFDPFIVNIYDGQELRYLKLKVEVQLSDEKAKTEMTERQAQIRDAILTILTTKTLQDVQYLQGKNQLKQEIMAALTKIVTPGKVRQVFFTDFVVQ